MLRIEITDFGIRLLVVLCLPFIGSATGEGIAQLYTQWINLC